MQPAQFNHACCSAGVSCRPVECHGEGRPWHARSAPWNAAECGSIPAVRYPKPPLGVRTGSGKLGTPWLRMHREYASAWARAVPPDVPDAPGGAVVVVAPRPAVGTVGGLDPVEQPATVAPRVTATDAAAAHRPPRRETTRPTPCRLDGLVPVDCPTSLPIMPLVNAAPGCRHVCQFRYTAGMGPLVASAAVCGS